eukprot:scaffold39546_cov45-Prasinocladus_malaysianus.AAC.1
MPDVATLSDLSDFDGMVDFVAKAKPEHPPGDQTQYHYLTYGWLVGGLVQKASGKPLTQRRAGHANCVYNKSPPPMKYRTYVRSCNT